MLPALLSYRIGLDVDELKTFLQNKKNLVTTAVIVVMLLVLPLGVYLAKVQQIFFSQAAGTLIQLAEEGSCITKNALGEKALKCGTVPLVLYNPFAPNTTHTSIDDGVIAYFPFDDNLATSSAEMMTGKLANVGGTKVVDGKLGKARKIEVNTVITYADSAAFDSDYKTVGAWVKPEAGTFKKDFFPSIIARRTNNNLGTTLEFTGYDNQKDGQVQCQMAIKNADGSFQMIAAISSNKADTGKWNYTACTYDGSKITVFMNGVATVGTQKVGKLAKFKDIERGYQQLVVGRNSHGGESLNGSIDEVTMWDRALTESEIKLLTDGTKLNPNQTNLSKGLVSYWNFDTDTSTEKVIDVKSGKNGEAIGAALIDYRGGKARKFDTQGQEIRIPDSFDFQKDTVSVSAWVKPAGVQGFGTGHFPSFFNKRPNPGNNGFTLEQAGYPNNQPPGRIPIMERNNGQLQFQFNALDANNAVRGSSVITTYDKIVPNVWNHIAAVYDGIEVKLYINGVISDFSILPGKMNNPANSLIKIGRNIITNETFIGDIDDVAYWGRGLSGLEIAQLAYNRKPSGDPIEAVMVPIPEYHAPIPPVAIACSPRPDVSRTTAMTAGGMVVTLTPGTNTNTPSNPISRINFTGFTNGTVKINGQAIAPNSTYTVPAGAANVVFTINQVTAGQATTINLNVVDGCGEYPLFFGGGANAGWPVPTPPPVVPTPTPAPVACNPRPNIGRSASMGPNGLTVTLTKATNANTPTNPMSQIQFTSLVNGTVTVNNQLQTGAFNYAIPAGTDTVTFVIKQVSFGTATTVFMKVIDTCGPYDLFFGGGTSANWPAPPVQQGSAQVVVTPVTVARGGTTNLQWSYTNMTPSSNDYFETLTAAGVHVQNIYVGSCGAFPNTVAVAASGQCALNTSNYGVGSYTVKLFRAGSTTPLSTKTFTVSAAAMENSLKTTELTDASFGAILSDIFENVAIFGQTIISDINGFFTATTFVKPANAQVAMPVITGSVVCDANNSPQNLITWDSNAYPSAWEWGIGRNPPFVGLPHYPVVGNWAHPFSTPRITRQDLPLIPQGDAGVSYQYWLETGAGGTRTNVVTLNRTVTCNLASTVTEAVVPAQVTPGAQFNVKYTFSNSGTTLWPSKSIGNTNSTILNITSNGAFTPKTFDLTKSIGGINLNVYPGKSHTFEVQVTAPTTPGSYSFTAELAKAVSSSPFGDNASITPFGTTSTKTIQVVAPTAPTGTLTAAPNPCTIAQGADRCTTTLTWNTQNSTDVKIKTGETLVFAAPSGTQAVNWITPANPKFDLYSGTTLLDTVTARANPPTPTPTPTAAPSPTPPPVVASPTPGPQCLQGNFSEAIIQEGQNCGVIEAKPASGATNGTIKFKAPNVTQSEAICTIKVTTNNAGGCSLGLPNGKGTASKPLSPGETIDISFGNSCSVNPLSDPALGSYTSNSGGCLVPVRISPEQAVPVKSEYTYKISETEAGLASAPEVAYEGTEVSILANYTLLDQNPGLKQFWVEFTDKVTGDKEKDFINAELLSADPEVIGVNCSSSLGSPNLVVDIYGKNLGANSGSASITVNNKPITKSTWENEYAKGVWNSPEPAVVDGAQYQVQVTLSDGRKLTPVSCGVGLSMVSLGTRLFCRGDGSFAVKGVKVLIVDEEGTKIEEMVDISHQGMITGIKSKFSEGKNYIISIKGANLIRRNITFKAQAGTTVVATSNGTAVVLPLGDIAPRPDGDGAINGIDQSLLKAQWRVIGDATQPLTGDFNVDKRVNSFDWACMRHDWNARDDEIPARAPRTIVGGTNTPVGSQSPSSSPLVCATAPTCSDDKTLIINPGAGGCASYNCVTASCTSNAQCGSGNICYNFQTYPGTCKPSDTVCAAAITRACNNAAPTECVDFPSPCHVPPGWTTSPRSTPNPSTTVACNPRPNIGRTATMTAQGLQVTLTQATNTNTPTNPMSKINFTQFDNGTVTIGNASPKTAAFTQDIAAGTTAQTFLIKQVTKGQPTTIQMIVVDGCGNYPLFFGGGTSAGWPQ